MLQPRKVGELAASTPINSSFSHSTLPAKTRLPKLSLPKFKGDVTTWMPFWDSYKAAIHDNTDIARIDKFNYLHFLLEGTAAQGLTLTDSNYDSAIDLLQQRFQPGFLIKFSACSKLAQSEKLSSQICLLCAMSSNPWSCGDHFSYSNVLL